MIRSLLLGVLALVGCGIVAPEPSGPCAPVDVGGECFQPSEEGFIAHAVTSAGAWPEPDGDEVTADRVIDGFDVTNDTRTWVVPLVAGGEMVAISRFIPVRDNQVKLGEVALLEEPLRPLPADLGGDFVLYVDSPRCIDNAGLDCVFSEYAWAVRLPDGRFRLPHGAVADDLGRGDR